MANYLTEFKDFLVEQASIHQVNPELFGCLYLLSKVLIVTFVAWAIKNLRARKPICCRWYVQQLATACLTFTSLSPGKTSRC